MNQVSAFLGLTATAMTTKEQILTVLAENKDRLQAGFKVRRLALSALTPGATAGRQRCGYPGGR